MQAVAAILIAAATGANPWTLPEAQDSVSAPETRTALDDSVLLAQQRADLKPAPLRQPAPARAANTNPYRRQGSVQPADHQQRNNVGDFIQPTQYVGEDAWPTSGAHRRDRQTPDGQTDRQTTPNLFNASPTPGADPYRPNAGREPDIPSFDEQFSSQNTDAFTTVEQPSGGSFRSQPRSLHSRDSVAGQGPINVPVFDQPEVVDHQLNTSPRQPIRRAQLDDPQRRAGDLRTNMRGSTQNAPALTDPFRRETATNPPFQPQRVLQKPQQSQGVVSGANSPPTQIQTDDAAFAQTPDIEVGVSSQQELLIKKPKKVVGDAAEQIRETAQGGGALLYLLLFASLGLNLYLGWIAWDTYNRYQDMISDLRYSGASNRRDRIERDHIDRRSERRLAESAY